MKKTLGILVLIAMSCGAQDTLNEYIVYKQTSLTSAAETVTIQQPTTPVMTIVGEVASVYCSVACDAIVTQLGTAASTTTLPTIPLNGGQASSAVAFSASNTSGGTVLNTIAVGAGATQTIDLSRLYVSRGSQLNFSIGTSSITGTTRITVQWQEKR
jgi:hypothetical protein